MMSFVLHLLLGILVLCPETGGRNLTWNEPPPTQIVQAVADPEKHFSSRQLFEGTINATLNWHFVLRDLIFESLVIILLRNEESVARVSKSVTGISPSYANQFRLDWFPNQNLVRLVILSVTTEDSGIFSCRVTADSLDGFSMFHFASNVQVDVVGPPSNIITSSNQTITAPAELTLNCSADGKPKPTITWRRVFDNTVVTMPLKVIRGKNKERYRCTADNGVGNPLTKDVIVNTLFSPKVTLAKNFFVDRGQTASLICQVDGNPNPTISWSQCDLPNVLCDKQYLNISEVQTARANYNCTARNAVGIESATTVLIIGGYHIYVRMHISGECREKDSSWEALEQELNRVFANTQSYSGAELAGASCGSLIFDVVLTFSTEVAEDETISTIQTAIVDGKLGKLSANVSSIIGIPPVKQTSTAAPTTTNVSVSRTGSLIGAVAGVAVTLAVIGGVLCTWCVLKARRRRKDFKIHNSDLERDDGEAGHSQVQGAYAQSGPPAANGTDSAAEQQLEAEAAIPTYAAVDKSKKSKKQADKRPPEYAVVDKSQKTEKQEAAAIPTYAAVDKSKKTKSREEVPSVYADVDKSKKKKKKKIDDKNLFKNPYEPKKEKKPGELHYVDLGDFQNPSMPAVSISPQPLPAIKKADPYERTDYADITQFLKGNATLPPNNGNGDTEMKPKRPSKKKEIQGNDKETPI